MIIGEQHRQRGSMPAYLQSEKYDARTVADAARGGDAAAQEVFRVCGDALGRGLSLLVDFLNPDRIVLGSVYARCEDLLSLPMQAALREECLPRTLAACQIVPAALGETIGDYAALALARQASQ